MTASTRLALALLLATACSEKEPPTASEDSPESARPEPAAATWWNLDNPCPEGELMRADRPVSSVYCETNKKRHGRYTVLRSDGVTPRVNGAFVHGKRDGTWRQFDPSGKELGSFELRAGTGTVVEWLDSGAVSMRFDKVDGARNGTWIKYYNQPASDADGEPARQEQGSYTSDARDGTWKFWSPTGDLDKEIDYAKGRVLETRTFDEGALVKTEKAAALDDSSKVSLDRHLAPRRASIVAMLGSKGSGAELGSALARLDGASGGGAGAGRRQPNPGARVKVSVVATGDLDREVVRRVLRSRHRAFTYCYERALQKKPGLTGKLLSRFVITSSGAARQVEASGLGDKTVEGCFARQIVRLKFPSPGAGNVKVKASFALSSSG